MKYLLFLLLALNVSAAETNKIRVVPGTNGLPEQITIAADPTELPLELRAQKDVPAAILQSLGRGEQLRAPIRLMAGQTDVTDKCQVKVTGTEFAVTPTGKFDSLALVIELAGVVDTVIADGEAFPIGAKDGVVWSKRVGECFVGSGDRGFTFKTGSNPAMQLERDKAGSKPAMQLERDKAGNCTWRILLENQPVKFNLEVFPTQSKPVGARRQTWLTTMPGAIAGDVASLSMHRYLAGTHAGRATQLRSQLGRALLLDAGVDGAGLVNLTEGLTVVKALEEFGALKDDGQTEFIPYWRAASVLRYGEAFDGADLFELAKENPVAAVQVSIWRRAGKALIAVVNESDQPVREQLYVLDPAKVFGGPNRATIAQVMAGWDDRAIPADSDWSKRRFLDAGKCLLDVTDSGFVRAAASKGGTEVYGPLYIAPHSYRLLMGTGK